MPYPVTGIQGFMSYMDENGDTEGNYTVLARAPYPSDYGNYSMLPVGHFQIGTSASSPLPVSYDLTITHLNMSLKRINALPAHVIRFFLVFTDFCDAEG